MFDVVADRPSIFQNAPVSEKKPKNSLAQSARWSLTILFISILNKLDHSNIIIRAALDADVKYATAITAEMESSAKARGTGIAKRSAEYVAQKIMEQKAVIAVTTGGSWVGFCYIEAWDHDSFVANSGLIVAPEFRKSGIAKAIKQKIFQLSREKYQPKYSDSPQGWL